MRTSGLGLASFHRARRDQYYKSKYRSMINHSINNADTLVQPGDIVMVRDGRSLIARGIIASMRRYKRDLGLLKSIPENYHHAGRIVDMWGYLHICEANRPGPVILKLDEAYTESDWRNRIDIWRPYHQYSESEKRELSRLAVKYSGRGVRYDFANFIYQLDMIFNGAWRGPTGERSKKRIYCSELVAIMENDIRPRSYDEAASVNPVDIVASGLYYKI